MHVEEMIQGMFDNYPDLFKTRADCYDHMFCTIGGGYYWENGELRSDYEGDIIPKNPLKDGKAFQYNKISLRDEKHEALEHLLKNERLLNLAKKTMDLQEFIDDKKEKIMAIPDDTYYEVPRKYRWYFYHMISHYAMMFNAPDDVTDEWKEALEDCKRMLREDGYTDLTPKETFENLEKENEKSKARIKEMMSHKGFYKD